MTDLVSVIMPAYNAEKHIGEAIESVLNQTYQKFELLIINDGSTDNTGMIINSFADNRLRCFEHSNRGVSTARNLGLIKMNGNYFCFLDSDDFMPKNSIESRLNLFHKDENLAYVDGVVNYVDENLFSLNKKYKPHYTGEPLACLLMIDPSCFFGNTWMIKRDLNVQYKFEEDMTHSEDLMFYLDVCSQSKGIYSCVEDEILWYRKVSNSAMVDLRGLENGYSLLIKKVRARKIGSFRLRVMLKLKILKIIFLSHLIDGKSPLKAILSIFRIGKA